ncbi:hypothetical protein LOTGIDRAFT_170797 [Lottia gigantea]|uniref:dCMP deaminase n=1 Tax=Lottia gigantea TaxID=225164 RepID=V4BAC2_LOTGI|nr:hypothetical protein LOTGIDRAFT_170797 [Lottia gigantea]ESP04406.1 hypothetical protein LOTGIDRAFT_170797 [Lottia gigantea]
MDEKILREGDGFYKVQSNDDYFMSIAVLTAKRSLDPVLKVGSCIADRNDKLVSTGFNDKTPGGASLPWPEKSNNNIDNKRFIVCHAEVTAIVNSKVKDLTGYKIYITHNPCNECSKLIAQCGIKHVIYLHEWKPDQPKYQAARLILQVADCNLRKYQGPLSQFKCKL